MFVLFTIEIHEMKAINNVSNVCDASMTYRWRVCNKYIVLDVSIRFIFVTLHILIENN